MAEDKNSKEFWKAEEALPRMKKYCAFQERCHSEVRYKLIEHGIYGDLLEEVIVALITEGFLDEERYARSYARGKFRINNWGKVKIKQELKSRQVSDYCIRAGLTEISDEEYDEVLKKLLEAKLRTLREKDGFARKQKLNAYAQSRGYEYGAIAAVIEDMDLTGKA